MNPRHRLALLVLFAVSGFTGLVYESVWTQYLKLFLGHAAYAQSLVLAIFMGGMAIGSWLASRYSGRLRDLLVAYAVAEAAVAVFALLFHEVFVLATDRAFVQVLGRLPGPAAIHGFKWSLGALLILPQCVLLGMTFPLMTAGVLRRAPADPGRSVALLYFANSLGAAVGVLASGFVLLRIAGLPGTTRLAGVVNLAVAAAVWGIARRAGAGVEQRPAEAMAAPSPGARLAYPGLLAVSLLTGAASFVYEVGWIRMLSLVLGTSTHAFELMLSAFILGLALGGLWIHRRIDRIAAPVRYLGWVQVAMGLLALATLPAYGLTFRVMGWLVGALERTDGGYALFTAASNGIALAVMLPATFCAGMTLPLITVALLRAGTGERSIGAVYAANTVGAIAGVVFAIHVGLPALGLKNLVLLGAAVDVAVGLALLWTAAAATRRFLPALGASAAGAGAVAATLVLVQLDPYAMASGVFRYGKLLTRGANEIVFHEDGKTATVTVVANRALGSLHIRTNGKPDAAIAMRADAPPSADEATQVLFAAIPLALHPSATTAAVVGLGSGLSTQTLLSHPRLARVDTVEIEEEMIEGAKHFRPRVERAYSDPRSRIFVDDAKTFFSAGHRRYDLVVSEPSNPWVSGVAGLFSREFYSVIRRHLAEDGVFAQWIQLYEIDVELVVSILKAIDHEFADWAVYATNHLNVVVVATPRGAVAEPDPGVFEAPELAGELGRLGVHGVEDLRIRRIGDKASWAGLLRAHRIAANSDYHPVLDQNAERARFLGASAKPLVDLARFPLPALELLSPAARPLGASGVTRSPLFPPSERTGDALAIRDHLLTGVGSHGAPPGADRLRRAAALRGWLESCDSPAGPRLSLDDLYSTLVPLVPLLAPAELEPIFALVDERCGAGLEPSLRGSLELLAATGRRDPAAMVAAATAALASADPSLARHAKYALAAGMLGAVAQGDRATARELWARHGGPFRGDPGLLLRILVAESEVAGATRARTEQAYR